MGIKTESITWDMKTIAVNKLFVFTAFLLMTTLFASCNEAPRHSLPCLERAVFGDPNQSPYILPFSVDESFRLIQGYCYSHGGHRNQLAYDFETSIGVPVLAARAGRVMKIRGDLPDDGKQSDPGQHNHIMIKHDDGTVAFYAHLKQNSIVIKVDEHVSQGQPIAQSGNSGNTQGLPHLHFGVYQDWPAQGGFNVAVNFRNAEGTLDHRGGLRPGGYFRALPY
jgi:murein DD-endopeptidase MepM/ murein hydrolase activator NlpD